MIEKVDFKKTLKPFYNPSIGGIHVVDVPGLNYLMIDGTGNPNTSPAYQVALEALYTLSYGVKFALKSKGYDHIVPPLEGLWWMDDMTQFTAENKDFWKWTMMIMQPEWVTPDSVNPVKLDAYKKKKISPETEFRFETYSEGLSIQILYVGAYADEWSTIAGMHRYIRENGYQTNGKHHEIYLGDPRKVAPDKLRTIIRQPIRTM